MNIDLYLEGESRELILSEPFETGSICTVAKAMELAFQHCVRRTLFTFFPKGFGLSKGRIDSTKDGVLRQKIKCSGTNYRYEVKDETLSLIEDSSVQDREFTLTLSYSPGEIIFINILHPRITNVMVSNYRAIRRLSISMADSGLVVVGLNGSGKTSLLEAVLLAFLQDKQVRAPVKDQDYEIVVDFEDAMRQSYRVVRTPNSHRIETRGGDLVASTEAEIKKAFAKVGIKFAPSNRRHDGLLPLSAGVSGIRRFSQRTSFNNVIQRICSVIIDAFIAREMNDSAAIGHLKGLEYLDRLNKVWSVFYPDRRVGFRVIRLPVLDDKRLRFNLVYRNDDENLDIELADLSSGEQEIFAMIGSLILEADVLDFVFLDEPELHLNRVWHRLLLDQLRYVAPKAQFLVATHSRDVASSVYSDQVIFMRDGSVSEV